MGSGSTGLLIADVDDTKSYFDWENRIQKRYITKISEGLQTNGSISSTGIEKSRDAFIDIAKIISTEQPNVIKIVGTQAMRTAKNADVIQALCFEHIGQNIEVISNEDEAKFTYDAVKKCFSNGLDTDMKNVLVVDIGGGSTELILNEKFYPHAYGVFTLSDEHNLNPDIPDIEDLANLMGSLKDDFSLLATKLERVNDKVSKIIVVGGSAASLVLAEEDLPAFKESVVHEYLLTKPMLEEWFRVFASETTEDRGSYVRASTESGPFLLASTAILCSLLRVFEPNEVTVSAPNILVGLCTNQS